MGAGEVGDMEGVMFPQPVPHAYALALLQVSEACGG